MTIKLWAEFSRTYINLSKLDLQLESKQGEELTWHGMQHACVGTTSLCMPENQASPTSPCSKRQTCTQETPHRTRPNFTWAPLAVLAHYRDGFLDARIAYGSTSYSYAKIIWNKNRPMVRFTNLAMHYSVGYNGGGYTLTFTMLYG